MSDLNAEKLIVEAVKLAARILTKRLIMLVGILLDFVLFVWTCVTPDYLHLLAAIAFGLVVLVYVAFPVDR